MSISKTWGTAALERKLAYPCDAYLPDPKDQYYSGITIKTDSGHNLIGDIHVSYMIIPLPNAWTRLLVKVSLRYPAGPIGWAMRALLPWGDFIMMRKQLLNFKEFSEASRSTAGENLDWNCIQTDAQGTDMLIDKFMPKYDEQEFHSRLVSLPLSTCYSEIRKVDWSGSLTSFLYRQGSKLLNLFIPKNGPASDMNLKVFENAGFWILEDNHVDEIVIGSYQRFSGKADIVTIPTAEEFIAFREPGVYKIAWSIGVGPAGDKSRIHTETRVQCTDEATRKRFALYWFFISRFSALTRVDFLRAVAKKCESPELH